MKIRITRSHIDEHGPPVKSGTILDLHEDHATDFINARLAVAHVEGPQIPVATKPVEKANRNRKKKETR